MIDLQGKALNLKLSNDIIAAPHLVRIGLVAFSVVHRESACTTSKAVTLWAKILPGNVSVQYVVFIHWLIFKTQVS